MPAWMRYVWREDPQRFLDFGRLVFGIEPVTQEEHISSIAAFAAPVDPNRPVEDAVTATIDALQEFFASIGMPTTMGELGLKPEDVDKLLPTLQQNKGEVFGAFKKLTMEDAKKIYLSAF